MLPFSKLAGSTFSTAGSCSMAGQSTFWLLRVVRKNGGSAWASWTVASLLLIHDLYPVDLQTRVIEALDTVRPYMESHGGNVELLALEHGVARIRLQGSCSDCSASSVTLELAIKQALDETARLPGGAHQWTASLRDLSPNTTYCYEVREDGRAVVERSPLTTAPGSLTLSLAMSARVWR